MQNFKLDITKKVYNYYKDIINNNLSNMIRKAS